MQNSQTPKGQWADALHNLTYAVNECSKDEIVKAAQAVCECMEDAAYTLARASEMAEDKKSAEAALHLGLRQAGSTDPDQEKCDRLAEELLGYDPVLLVTILVNWLKHPEEGV